MLLIYRCGVWESHAESLVSRLLTDEEAEQMADLASTTS
jgi:hypothetical protein